MPPANADDESSFRWHWDALEHYKQRPQVPQSSTASVQSVSRVTHDTDLTSHPRARNARRLEDESDDTESSHHDRLSATAVGPTPPRRHLSSTPTARAQKRRSQNRKAQQAFRDRQRQRIDSLEQSIEALAHSYAALQTEHRNLNVAYEALLLRPKPQAPAEPQVRCKTEPWPSPERGLPEETQPMALTGPDDVQDYFSIPVPDQTEMLPAFDLVLDPVELEMDYRSTARDWPALSADERPRS